MHLLNRTSLLLYGGYKYVLQYNDTLYIYLYYQYSALFQFQFLNLPIGKKEAWNWSETQEHENRIHVHKKVLHAHISLSDYNIQSLTYKDYPLSIYDCSVIDTFFHKIKITLSQGIL